MRASGTAVHGRTEAPETCPYKRSSADESGDAKRCSNEAAHRTQPRPEVHLSKLDDEARRSSPDTNFLKAEDRSPLGKGMFLDFFPAQGDFPQPSNRWVYLICFDSTGDQRWKPFWLEKKRATAKTILSWIRSGRISIVHVGTPCTVFSGARHFIRHHAGAREKERVGLKLALFTAEVISVCMRHGVEWSLGSPIIADFLKLLFLCQLLNQKEVYSLLIWMFVGSGKPSRNPHVFSHIFTSKRYSGI